MSLREKLIGKKSFNGKPFLPFPAELPRTVPCPHCGSRVVYYRRMMQTPFVAFMRALAERRTEGLDKRDLRNLTYSARNTGHMAYLWGLVSSAHPTNRGSWTLTDSGRKFLAGKIAVPAACIEGSRNVARFEGPMLYVHDVPTEVNIYEKARAQAAR